MAYPQVTTVVNGNTAEIVTTQRLVPTVQTTIKSDTPTITTIVENYWDGIWSVNGQTGDVVLTFTIDEFLPNTTYAKNSAVIYDAGLYIAKQAFVSGSTFNLNDWIPLSGAYTADNISYDNTSTHISATNVQDALDYVLTEGAEIEYIVTNTLPTTDIHEKALYLIPINESE